jgi:hypothetical protein
MLVWSPPARRTRAHSGAMHATRAHTPHTTHHTPPHNTTVWCCVVVWHTTTHHHTQRHTQRHTTPHSTTQHPQHPHSAPHHTTPHHTRTRYRPSHNVSPGTWTPILRTNAHTGQLVLQSMRCGGGCRARAHVGLCGCVAVNGGGLCLCWCVWGGGGREGQEMQQWTTGTPMVVPVCACVCACVAQHACTWRPPATPPTPASRLCVDPPLCSRPHFPLSHSMTGGV